VRRHAIRRPLFVALACALLLGGPAVAAQGDPSPFPEPVPGSCKLHHNKVLNPGCVPDLTETVEGAVDEATAYERTYPDLSPDVTEVFAGIPTVTFNPQNGTLIFGPPALYFDTWARNLGHVAVDLQTEDAANLEDPPASQCVAWRPDRVCREREIVGGFVSHPTHGHIHFEGFAAYELRSLLPDGSPDYSAAGVVGTSDKVSFCLIDFEPVAPHAAPVPFYQTCTGLQEGISAGWTDIYASHLDGQQISLDGVADGDYALIVRMNVEQNLYETTHANNRVVLKVRLSNIDDPMTMMAEVLSKDWS
jgi:hypothetical protein